MTNMVTSFDYVCTANLVCYTEKSASAIFRERKHYTHFFLPCTIGWYVIDEILFIDMGLLKSEAKLLRIYFMV